jgi:hypothetical protein
VKQLLGLKKHRRCEVIGGKEYVSCYTRGGWPHGEAQCWLKSSQRADGTCVEYDHVNYLTGKWEIGQRTGRTTQCDRCGETLYVGDYPFCPHGRGASGALSDDIPGGRTYENLGPVPVTVYSKSELRRELKARGLEEFVRHVPVPGSDRSPHTTSWTAVDLEAGRVLAERQAHTKASAPEYRADPVTIETIKQVYEEHYARHGRD